MFNLLEEFTKYTDEKHADFNAKLIPTLDRSKILGVRIPDLRKIAKNKANELNKIDFLGDLPHRYLEENLFSGIVLSSMRDFDQCIERINDFLPYVDNWAACDILSPKILTSDKKRLLRDVDRWIKTDQIYTVRFAIGVLMSYFLDSDFRREYLEMVAKIKFDDYYVKMMQAWYFATALAKQWQDTIVYLEQRKLETWVHNKTIQKAIESRRISDENKKYLRTLKIK